MARVIELISWPSLFHGIYEFPREFFCLFHWEGRQQNYVSCFGFKEGSLKIERSTPITTDTDRLSNEPIETRSRCMQRARSAGKRVGESYDWFWLYLSGIGWQSGTSFLQPIVQCNDASQQHLCVMTSDCMAKITNKPRFGNTNFKFYHELIPKAGKMKRMPT